MKKALSIISYIISILIMIFYIYIDLNTNTFFSTTGRLILLCSSCVFTYIGGLLYSKYKGNNKPMKISLWIFFILYLILFITLTLFDPMFGRMQKGFITSKEVIDIYLKNSFNIIPFKTIFNYIYRLFSMSINLNIVITNLIGNLVCLMPLGLFIPLLFKKYNNTKSILVISITLVFIIEILQFITLSGSCDIDDIILNVLGAYIAFKITNIKCVNDLLHNIFFLEKNKLDIKGLIKIVRYFVFIILILVLIYTGIVIKYNSDYTKNNNYKIEIIDETDICAQALEKFYEDRYHEYYFGCIKSDNVYAIINGKKYLVKDLLNNNPTDYVININRLKTAGLEFIVEDKYPSFTVTYKEYASLEFNIEDESLVDIEAYESISEEDGTVIEKYYVIPKKEGMTNFKVIYDNKEELYNISNYNNDPLLTKVE